MAGYFVLKKSGDQFMFNLKAGNHEVILTSERYVSKKNAEGGIASVRTNSGDDGRPLRAQDLQGGRTVLRLDRGQ